eukprot:Partr_v1_DN23311_c1_g1_i1_m18270 putative 40s ribosomal protein s12
MSSAEGDVEVVEVAADSVPVGQLSVEDAIQIVLKKSLVHDGLSRGINECARALEKREAQLCILAESCDQADYLKLVEALCGENQIKLIKVPDAKQLGEWAGLCKVDREGTARKVVGCGVVVVRDFGEETEAMNVLNNMLASQE